jgi:hypothetical protein
VCFTQVGLHLASKDWRNRSDALAALSALLPALPEVPNAALEELLGSLVARLADSNAKVNVQALQVCACGGADAASHLCNDAGSLAVCNDCITRRRYM